MCLTMDGIFIIAWIIKQTRMWKVYVGQTLEKRQKDCHLLESTKWAGTFIRRIKFLTVSTTLIESHRLCLILSR